MKLLKCCTQYASKFGKLSSGHRTGKGQFSFQSKEGKCHKMLKLPYNCPHLTQVVFKILQVRLQQYMNHKLPDVQAGVRKGRGTRDQIVNISWIMEKAREFCQKKKKKSASASLTMPTPLTVWLTINCGKC